MIRLILCLTLLSILAACSPQKASCRNILTGGTIVGERWSRGIDLVDANGFHFGIDHSNGSEWVCEDIP